MRLDLIDAIWTECIGQMVDHVWGRLCMLFDCKSWTCLVNRFYVAKTEDIRKADPITNLWIAGEVVDPTPPYPLFQVLCKSWGFGQMSSVIMCDYESIWIDMIQMMCPLWNCWFQHANCATSMSRRWARSLHCGRGGESPVNSSRKHCKVRGSAWRSWRSWNRELGSLRTCSNKDFWDLLTPFWYWNSWNVQSAAICSVSTLCSSIIIIDTNRF